MKQTKGNIKTYRKVDEKESDKSEGGEVESIKNRCVFTIFCASAVSGIKKQIPSKPSSVKQVVTYSLISLDEETKRGIIELIRNNKAFDVVVEKWIHSHKKQVLDFFSGQKDKTSSTAVLKQRIAELEAKVGGKNE